MLLSEYIENLKETLENDGDAEVCITQEGYYAEGMFADINEFPEKLIQKKDSKVYWVLGHSQQITKE